MRILLLGEYSSAHNYLKVGLQELGHEVILGADGDGWKKIPGFDFYTSKVVGETRIIKSLSYIVTSFQGYKKAVSLDYDVIQLINPQIFHWVVNLFLVKRILKHFQAKCKSLSCCGVDWAQCKAYVEGKYENYIFDHTSDAGYLYLPNNLRSKICRNGDIKIVDKIDILIPAMYDYEVGYCGNHKLTRVVPLPIDVKSIKFQENIVSDKIVIFHGVSNPTVKGSKFILGALDKLKRNYPNDVTVIVREKMPFSEYVEFMKRTNVLIDQCLTYSYGINACIGLAEGKIVVTSLRPESLKSFGINVEECPIVPIIPDVEQIYKQLENIIVRKNEILEWGRKSRKYVEKIHDCVKVAQQYIDAWKGTGKI